MSATPSAPRSSRKVDRAIDVALTLFCALMLTSMWVFTGAETIPYHFLFLAVAMVYGFRVWPMRRTTVVVAVITFSTGYMFLRAYRAGSIGLDEMSEVLLMPLLLMAMVWHARRRHAAMRATQRLAEANRALLEREHELLRDTSHAIRAPITIARGHVELAVSESSEASVIEDLQVVIRQLDRTETLSSRLLSLSAFDAEGVRNFDMIDLTDVIRRVSQDWAGGGDRTWVHQFGPPTWILGEVVGIEAAIDATVENAIHFTRSCDTIRLSCRKIDGFVLVQVADSGPGIDERDRPFVFDRFWHRAAPDGVVGSGLGLSMVWAVTKAHGGHVSAEVAPEGGVVISMAFPRPTASMDQPFPEPAPESLTTTVTKSVRPADAI
jgi:signal transduction histidine kinase